MSYASPETLVDTAWLAERLDDPAIRIVDGSWYMPAEKRDPAAEFELGHLPGAVFFDIDAIADTSIPLPHMFPPADVFAAAVGAMGIANGDHVVCTSGGSMMTACRVWWMFRAFGHGRLSVLDGGTRKWQAEDRRMVAGAAAPTPAAYTATLDPAKVALLGEMMALTSGDAPARQILDARSPGRFSGADPEPRAGLRSGHMPGAVNLPWQAFVGEDGTMKNADGIGAALADARVASARPLVASCGSGVSAAMLLLGLHLVGRDDIALYDGSWSEWGSREDTPIVTG